MALTPLPMDILHPVQPHLQFNYLSRIFPRVLKIKTTHLTSNTFAQQQGPVNRPQDAIGSSNQPKNSSLTFVFPTQAWIDPGKTVPSETGHHFCPLFTLPQTQN